MKARPAFISHLQRLLAGAPIRNITRIFGGHINHAYKLTTDNASFFVKVNSSQDLPDMFADEAKGLQLLADTHTVSIPGQIAHGHFEDLTFLLMEWIEPGSGSPALHLLLGRQLAAMHRHTNPSFGLEWDHHSLLTQSNKPHQHWSDFFIHERLRPTLTLAIKKGYLTIADQNNFEKLYSRIPQIFPQEPPALLHGDLWKANCIFGADGQSYLVDATPYYGHREMDIAMTSFVDSFDDAFYAAYNEAYPLEKDWEQRIDLCHLYPLLILTTLGPDYRDRLRTALKKYI